MHTNLHDSIKRCGYPPNSITCSTRAFSQQNSCFNTDVYIPGAHALYCHFYYYYFIVISISIRFPNSSDTCIHCGKGGHWAESCYQTSVWVPTQHTTLPTLNWNGENGTISIAAHRFEKLASTLNTTKTN